MCAEIGVICTDEISRGRMGSRVKDKSDLDVSQLKRVQDYLIG